MTKMSLQEILISTCGGFLTGLGFGLGGIPEKFEERLEVAEIIPEERRGVTDERINHIKNRMKQVKYTVPAVIGGMHSLLASGGVHDSYSLAGNAALAIPSAYLGKYVGAVIRKIRTRDRFNDQKLRARIAVDPDNMDKYLLSDGERGQLDKSFSEIEQKILEGNEAEVFFGKPNEGPLKEVYELFMKKEPGYASLLLFWSLSKHVEVARKAMFQRDVTKFYEAPYQEKMGPGEAVVCALMGYPEDIRLKVFVKERNDFYVQTFDWPNLKIVSDDNVGASAIKNAEPETSVSDREIWTGDYKSLAEFITKEKEGHSVMLMKAPLELSSEIRERMVTTTFLPHYESYHRSKQS